MLSKEEMAIIKNIADNFDLAGELTDACVLTNGLINSTYRLICDDNKEKHGYILQRINTNVFKDPIILSENIKKVTAHIKEKMQEEGSYSSRRVLNFIKAKNGEYLYFDNSGGVWRTADFIENAKTYDSAEHPRQFYEAGRGFGQFQKYLADFNADTLKETIPNFHNTASRLEKFKNAVENDCVGRAKEVIYEISELKKREELAYTVPKLLSEGKISVRVTHNDTKLNNIMIDNETEKALCVLDLDTVMPGTVLFDYGDAIRFGASTAPEDEKDLNKIGLNEELFSAFTKGFIEETGAILPKSELEALPLGVISITYEQSLRFLTDYLEGDTYFKTKYKTHNLIRARAQLKLLTVFEEKLPYMLETVKNLIEK